MSQDLFDLHADVCKTLSSPARLRIIDALREGELSAGEICLAVGARKANVSQHLAVMRERGIVESRRSGTNVYYSLTNPKVVQAFQLMREVIVEQMEEKAALLAGSRRAGGAP